MKHFEKMPPKPKSRSGRKKKRKFGGNRYTVVKKTVEKEGSVEQESAEETTWCSNTDPTKMRSIPASERKLDEKSEESDGSSSDEDCKTPEGFRLVNLSILYSAFQLLCCLACKYGRVELEEDDSAKMGFASLLLLKCRSHKC